jgi:hypothetical protein
MGVLVERLFGGMVMRSSIASLLLLVCLADWSAAAQSPGPGPAPRAMSPAGDAKQDALAASCPTLAWTTSELARGYELVLYRLDEATGEVLLGEPAVRKVVPAGASAWTLDGACLVPGARYGWAVRALAANGGGPWSAPAIFRVRPQLTPELIAAVIGALREGGVDVPGEGAPGEVPVSIGAASAAGSHGSAEPEARGTVSEQSVNSSPTAIRGELSAFAGETYGVVGISNSAAGAGIAATGAPGGADLVLDGELDGATDARLSQSSLDRPSGNAETFDFKNSGAGTMGLSVDGHAVIHTGNLTSITATGVLDSMTINGGLTLQNGALVTPAPTGLALHTYGFSPTNLTVITDGTGDTEVLLPAQSIGTNEIADHAITSAKLNAVLPTATMFLGRVNNLTAAPTVPLACLPADVQQYALASGSAENPSANQRLPAFTIRGCTASNFSVQLRDSATGDIQVPGTNSWRSFSLMVDGSAILTCVVGGLQSTCSSSGTGAIPDGGNVYVKVETVNFNTCGVDVGGRLATWGWDCN